MATYNVETTTGVYLLNTADSLAAATLFLTVSGIGDLPVGGSAAGSRVPDQVDADYLRELAHDLSSDLEHGSAFTARGITVRPSTVPAEVVND